MEYLRSRVRSGAQTFRGRLAALPPGRRRVALGGLAAGGLFLLLGLGAVGYFWRLSVQFPEAPFRQPSRLYGAPAILAMGAPMTGDDLDRLASELTDEGYREATAPGPLAHGTFRRSKEKEEGREVLAVHLRRFATPQGPAGGVPVEVVVHKGRIARLGMAGRAVRRLEMEPPLLASYYGPDIEERRPVLLDELPEPVVQAVLAAEDDAFFAHPGVSIPGIARAAWKNARGGEVQQGGSTITQQLVKNLYLTHERTLGRKVLEAGAALVLEVRHGKRAILEAYLNEIYWGRSGPANLIGLGAAARAYFGKDAADLSLTEAATLAGMIRAPADYSPVDHPERARERRDQVLARLGDLGWIEKAQVAAARAEPLATHPQPVVARRLAPYFADAAAEEARERFQVEELADAGYLLFSTLQRHDQERAEEAVTAGLARLSKGPERKSKAGGPLQAALVSLDPRDGAILAYVGGSDYGTSQFDRVSRARRQAGSAFKPVVYATAFTAGVATPATTFKDSPIVVRHAGQSWRPQNNDRTFHGTVTARAALARSLNVPTVRVALATGLSRVIGQARAMGIDGPMEPLPALALGAVEATPREMAAVYATLATGGLRPPVHGLTVVLDRGGEPVAGEPLPSLERVVEAQAAYLVTSILEGVVDHGIDPGGPGFLAGKTGTTSGRRDNWFAGYSADRTTVVWVGYDDNSRTRLSGASAALPIWSRFTRAVRPRAGWPELAPPPGMVTALIDPETGQLATELCPRAVREVFGEWEAPTQPCTRHSQGWSLAGTWQEANLSDGGADPYGRGEPYDVPYAGNDPYAPEEAYPYPAEGDAGLAPASEYDPHTPVAVEDASIEIRRRRPTTAAPGRNAAPAVGVRPEEVFGTTAPEAAWDEGFEEAEDWSGAGRR